ncbi:MAG TPA: hypothetical protein VNA19_05415 [Pyrinomonadaceae bacterium]|jgi:hypothetical protein|nr:hypothetical protein [Pyrinomonadaceae bacterium]
MSSREKLSCAASDAVLCAASRVSPNALLLAALSLVVWSSASVQGQTTTAQKARARNAETQALRNRPAQRRLPARAQEASALSASPVMNTTGAQVRTDNAQAQSASEVSPEEADIAITANVTARELRFEKVPNPTVEFTGQPRRETLWEAERQNLPRPVRAGETYRDIGIRLRILSVFKDIDRIVAEALGEVPVNDDANGEGNPNPPQPSTQPTPQPTQPTPTPAPASDAQQTGRRGTRP